MSLGSFDEFREEIGKHQARVQKTSEFGELRSSGSFGFRTTLGNSLERVRRILGTNSENFKKSHENIMEWNRKLLTGVPKREDFKELPAGVQRTSWKRSVTSRMNSENYLEEYRELQ